MKRVEVRTRNKELYHKFNMLNLVPEVIIDFDSEKNIEKIIGSINKKSVNLLQTTKISKNKMLVRKTNGTNLNVYLR